MAADPGLEGVLDRVVVDPAPVQQPLVGFELPPFPGDALWVDLPDRSPGVCQGVADLEMAEGLRELADPRLPLVDDQAVVFGDRPDAIQQCSQEGLVRMEGVEVVRVAAVVLHAHDDLGVVVDPVRVDDADVLARLVPDVDALPLSLISFSGATRARGLLINRSRKRGERQ